MSTVSLTLPSDGDTIDASDVNNPLNAIAAVINGGIDSTNITAGGLTPANLTSGTGSSWAWQSWAPTWTNLTVGNGTVAASYIQIGKTVFYRVQVTFGTTSAMATDPRFTVPVTMKSAVFLEGVGRAVVQDTSASAYYFLSAHIHDVANIRLQTEGAGGAIVAPGSVSSTVPMTWASTDLFTVTGFYEAA